MLKQFSFPGGYSPHLWCNGGELVDKSPDSVARNWSFPPLFTVLTKTFFFFGVEFVRVLVRPQPYTETVVLSESTFRRKVTNNNKSQKSIRNE